MRISEKITNLLENGWEIHEHFDNAIGTNGGEAKIPIGLKPGQVCREIDGIFLVYVGDNNG